MINKIEIVRTTPDNLNSHLSGHNTVDLIGFNDEAYLIYEGYFLIGGFAIRQTHNYIFAPTRVGLIKIDRQSSLKVGVISMQYILSRFDTCYGDSFDFIASTYIKQAKDYNTFNAHIDSVMLWDDNFAPDGWDYNRLGTPSVVTIKYSKKD